MRRKGVVAWTGIGGGRWVAGSDHMQAKIKRKNGSDSHSCKSHYRYVRGFTVTPRRVGEICDCLACLTSLCSFFVILT